jgi:hypothetical protein
MQLRILGETPPNYEIEVIFTPSLAKDMTLDELHRVVINDLLPSIGAIDISNAP